MKKKLLLFITILFFPIIVLAEGLPSGDFTTNITSPVLKNYVKMAYRSKSMTSTFIDSFNVPLSLNTQDNGTPLYLLSKNLGTPSTSNVITPSDNNPVEVLDDGIHYILTNGYQADQSNDNIFTSGKYGVITDSSAKQYITQIALWMYLYQNKDKFKNSYCANKACDFLDFNQEAVEYQEVYDLVKDGSKISGYELLGYIIDLVDNAKTYKKESSSISSISGDTIEYSVDNLNKVIKTNAITPSAKGNASNLIRLEISLEDPDQYGAYLVDDSDQKIEDYTNLPNKFYIIVPLKEDVSSMNLNHITLRIKGYFKQSRIYDYYANGEELSHVLYGTVPTEEVSRDFTLKNFVKISTLDPKNELLAGATMVLTKKGDSSFKTSWVTNGEAHFLQLGTGEYTLCETKAPKGFSASEECIEFKVDGENVTVLDVKNEEKIEIPNTAKFQGLWIKIFGSVFILIGVAIVGYYFYGDENKA